MEKIKEKKKDIAIDSLNISIGLSEITLTIEEAKKLKIALDDLFGKEVVRVVDHHWHYDYSKPYYPRWGEVWCGGTAVEPLSPKFEQPQIYNSGDSKTLCMSIK